MTIKIEFSDASEIGAFCLGFLDSRKAPSRMPWEPDEQEQRSEDLDQYKIQAIEDGEEIAKLKEDLAKSRIDCLDSVAVINGLQSELGGEVRLLIRALSCGSAKIQAIKSVRALTGYGLKEAKDLFEQSFSDGLVDKAVWERRCKEDNTF